MSLPHIDRSQLTNALNEVEQQMMEEAKRLRPPAPTPPESRAIYQTQLLNEREKTHGDFRQNAAMAQAIKMAIRQGKNWDLMPPEQKESMDMICTKFGRLLTGNPNDKEHWDDIAGYAKLIAERL